MKEEKVMRGQENCAHLAPTVEVILEVIMLLHEQGKSVGSVKPTFQGNVTHFVPLNISHDLGLQKTSTAEM